MDVGIFTAEARREGGAFEVDAEEFTAEAVRRGGREGEEERGVVMDASSDNSPRPTKLRSVPVAAL